ncbi:2'-5' RNA ligase family protein [Flavobacterium sp. N3904]|uniref:2'-5' RNA ligase family protein n=1 Tax=Flavobacterium sp. N3904 TaxID=2986835 RepID=UPI002224828E|nr:2'-5' RNA ligase family protein [Flavobacterium sp. N3904]
MEKLYSLVIQPPEPILASIMSMKEQLAAEVGWFNSKNSVGHITICEFKATGTSIEVIKNQISKLCDALSPIVVYLNEFSTFSNGAFVINPDSNSKKRVKEIMKLFHKSLLIPSMKKSDNPHLSIARKLSPQNLIKANHLFTTINLNFVCDNVVLRLFDEDKKQFFVTDTFEFKSNKQSEAIQGELF